VEADLEDVYFTVMAGHHAPAGVQPAASVEESSVLAVTP
jgi:hypothetical protein